MEKKFKEFRPTSWSIDNKTAIYLLTIFITLAGILTYSSLPKEKFPDIVLPTIAVATVYPGASPKNVENLVTKPIEKKLKAISGVKKITSSSVQNMSVIMVEFNSDAIVAEAKQKVKDAVDDAAKDLPPYPTEIIAPPSVSQIEFSEMPILFVNVSGDYSLDKLKVYADELKDKIETLKEIKKVELVGALDREIQINLDMHKMQASMISLYDIYQAVNKENKTSSAGNITVNGMSRSVSISADFTDIEKLGNLVINSGNGSHVYLRDIAEVKDSHKEQESFGRHDGKNVITLNIVKKAGENLIASSDKIREIVEEMQANSFPESLKVEITGDQSKETRITLHDLINTIIIGFILVTIILMFFMGATNAMFVGLSVPLSMFIAFIVLSMIGYSMNMIVLFAFLLGLGIVVDDAIVVIENTHRIYDNGKMPIKQAAKYAAGEVFLPVLSGTATTLAPFVPLAFWSGMMGEFMKYLPITLIITLTASLVVAYIMNPVFAVSFMKPHGSVDKEKKKRRIRLVSVLLIFIAVLCYAVDFSSGSEEHGARGVGNFMLAMLLVYLFYQFVMEKAIEKFQTKLWPAVQHKYSRFLDWALSRPGKVIGGTFGLLVLSIILMVARQPKVEFFPTADPNFIYVYVTLPIGTDVHYTDSITRVVEHRVMKVLEKDTDIVVSVMANVAIGASEDQFDRSAQSHKGKVGVAFVEFGERDGRSTADFLDKIRKAVKGIPGAEITVGQEQNGPPVGKPVSIEISGDRFEDLMNASNALKHYLDSLNIPGIEELKTDLINSKPEISFKMDRERLNREGINTDAVGLELRTAISGWEISRFKDANEDYPIMLRYKEDQRKNIDVLSNMKMTYRDMAKGGQIRQVPVSAFTDIEYGTSYGGIKRKNQKRVVTLGSNVLSDYNPNEVVAEIQAAAAGFKTPEGVEINYTGQQEEQAEQMGFLSTALLISVGIIILILIIQFNSISKTLIIVSEILLSIIGVLLGLAITGMNFSIIMTMIGIVALAGIVVRNGILLVEFIDILVEEGMPVREAVVEAGKIRMTPVILTATATILGMVPLAVGFNIDFVTMFTHLDPHLYFGGDSVAFWGPLSWTIIFGLAFATFLTLILVPVLYYLAYRVKEKVKAVKAKMIAPKV
ncbi:MAG: efflux RND transporter permease subunit [Bacteroidetes bacterium]|nr:efflux RND transporter permease subunit [Bacteroidota bacterium]